MQNTSEVEMVCKHCREINYNETECTDCHRADGLVTFSDFELDSPEVL